MPKYHIKVTATVEVETENVMQAKDAASRVRLIGQHYEHKGKKNDKHGSTRKVSVVDFEMDNPKRVRT